MQHRKIGRNKVQHLFQISNALSIAHNIQDRPAFSDLFDQTRKTKSLETIGYAVDNDMLAIFNAWAGFKTKFAEYGHGDLFSEFYAVAESDDVSE